MILMGLGIIISISKDLKNLNFLPGEKNYLSILKSNKPLINFLAGFLIAISLITGSLTLYYGWQWGVFLSLVSLVALIHFSLRNFGWQSSEKEVLGYRFIMVTGFVGGAVSIVILILNFQ